MDVTGPIGRPHHLLLLVDDLDVAVALYEGLGFGPFRPYGSLDAYTTLDVPDRDAFRRLPIRVCDLGGIELQLCAPGPGDTPYRRFLEERGPGAFHLGLAVDDLDAAGARAAAQGLAPIMGGRRDDGSGFLYVDAAAAGGGIRIALRQSPADAGAALPAACQPTPPQHQLPS